MSDELISPSEAARILGMSPLSVRRVLNAGLMPAVEVKGKGGGVRRRTHDTVRKVWLADVEAFAKRFPVRNGRRCYRERKPQKPLVGDSGEFVGTARAAELCGVCQATVGRWISLGVLEAERLSTPTEKRVFYRIRKANLQKFLALRDAHKSAFETGQFITQQEAAKICSVSQAELCRWIKQGRLAASKIRSTLGQAVNRLARADLDAFLAAGRPRAPGLTTTRAAARLGLSRHSVVVLINSGRLPAVMRGNRRIIAERDLEAFRVEVMSSEE